MDRGDLTLTQTVQRSKDHLGSSPSPND